MKHVGVLPVKISTNPCAEGMVSMKNGVDDEGNWFVADRWYPTHVISYHCGGLCTFWAVDDDNGVLRRDQPQTVAHCIVARHERARSNLHKQRENAINLLLK
jgi:hypothetical protein